MNVGTLGMRWVVVVASKLPCSRCSQRQRLVFAHQPYISIQLASTCSRTKASAGTRSKHRRCQAEVIVLRSVLGLLPFASTFEFRIPHDAL